MPGRAFLHFAASFLLHGCVAGLVLVFSSHGFASGEKVYRVTLADFAAPAERAVSPRPASSEPAVPELPEPEPVIERPAPVPRDAPRPEAKIISAKKKKARPKPVAEVPPAPPPPARASAAPLEDAGGSSGGPPVNMGGFAAYEADKVDQRPAIARMIVPEYPLKARRMNVQGKVLVRLVVDASGRPKECVIYRADPAGYFEDAALAAARKTRFIPGKVRGCAVNTVVLIPFVFALR